MKLLSQVFTSFLLSIFGFFLGSPIFALGTEYQGTVIVETAFSDVCKGNLQCEKNSNEGYVCRSTGEGLTSQGGSIHHIPVGKIETDLLSCRGYLQFTLSETIVEKNITYIGPDTFVYPFVGIIKIQV